MSTSLTLAEILTHTTVRLECQLKSGSVTGTGFFFTFRIDKNNNIPIIVTNKHVIEESVIGTFVLTKTDAEGKPIVGAYEKIVLNDFENLWIKHPQDDVDLAVFALAPILNSAEAQNIKFFTPTFEESQIPLLQQLDELSSIENITMIGYPNGIWDERNNMPIVRKGITATSPKYDYNGLPLFVIDCACFPGSSGSPILIFDQGSYTDVRGDMYLSSRVILLGVLFAGPQHVAEGEIKTIDVPLRQIPISLSKIPNNLGFVVKSQKILDFKPILMNI